MLDEIDRAIIDSKAAILAKNDEFWPHVCLAAAYSSLGKNDDARAAYDRASKLKPELSATYIKSLLGTLHSRYSEKYLDALRKAGMPEE